MSGSMGKLLHRAHDSGYAFDAIQRSLRRLGRLFLQIRRILLLFRCADLLDDLAMFGRSCHSIGQQPIFREDELITREYGLQKVHAITNDSLSSGTR